MNITCAMNGHDWREDYPGFPTDISCTKAFVCRRCGYVRFEGPGDKPLKNRLGGVVHLIHEEMCKPNPDRKKIKELRRLHEMRKQR